MSWNHRILAKQSGEEVFYQMYEVYYDENGKPNGYGENGVVVGGSEVNHIKWQLTMMKYALKEPVLSLDNFPEQFKKK